MKEKLIRLGLPLCVMITLFASGARAEDEKSASGTIPGAVGGNFGAGHDGPCAQEK